MIYVAAAYLKELLITYVSQRSECGLFMSFFNTSVSELCLYL